jgi:hypothetical protein
MQDNFTSQKKLSNHLIQFKNDDTESSDVLSEIKDDQHL